MTRLNGVSENKRGPWAARNIGRLHRGGANHQVYGGYATGGGDRGCLIHRYGDADHIAGIERVTAGWYTGGRCESDASDYRQHVGDRNGDRLGCRRAQAIKGGDGDVVDVVCPRIQLVLEIGARDKAHRARGGADSELGRIGAAQRVAYRCAHAVGVAGGGGVDHARRVFGKAHRSCTGYGRCVVVGDDLHGHIVGVGVRAGAYASAVVRVEVGV